MYTGDSHCLPERFLHQPVIIITNLSRHYIVSPISELGSLINLQLGTNGLVPATTPV